MGILRNVCAGERSEGQGLLRAYGVCAYEIRI